MRTALRRMGNSTGLILPRGILSEVGVSVGAEMDVTVEGERVVLAPVRAEGREGWAEDAAAVAEAEDLEAAEWLGARNEADADLRW